MISMDTLIVQIMNQAQKLVNADRASLFLVDSRSRELYARCIGTDRHFQFTVGCIFKGSLTCP